MKSLFLLAISLLLLIACSPDDVPITPIEEDYINIPDAIFESILIDQGIDSEGFLDQRILRNDAEQTTHLDLSSANSGRIKDLSGIEGFVNLRVLLAGQHEIETVDLIANTLLDTLFLNANFLSEIDLSNNPHLIYVNLEANKISSIRGLQKLTALKKLDVSFNYLQSFTLDNESIETLFITDNLLDSLEIKRASNLEGLVANRNKLSWIELESAPLLETLLLSGNELQAISLEKQSSLVYFYISSNLLTELDISLNPNLVDLRVDRNPNLSCIKINAGQEIPTIRKSDDQQLNSECN
ncbi:MAG: hypothetical protein AAFY45_31725 [Bacteroidota bacterium]